MDSSQNEQFLWYKVYPEKPPHPSVVIMCRNFGHPDVAIWHIPTEPPIENTEDLFSRCKQQPTAITIYGLMSPCWWKKEREKKKKKISVMISHSHTGTDEIKNITQKMKNMKIDKKQKRLIGKNGKRRK